MKFGRFAISSLLAVPTTSAFTPASRHGMTKHRVSTGFAGIRSVSLKNTALQANVLKLTDPESELLDKIDTFIFDCDGVIWRVSPGIGGTFDIANCHSYNSYISLVLPVMKGRFID
jgi:hypothetical protein